MNQEFVDEISSSVIRLESFSGGRKTGVAAGFLYRRNSGLFLVTNWHVVTGRDANHPQISKDGSFTTHLRANYLMKAGDRINIKTPVVQEIVLNDDDGNGLRWLQHPVLGNQCDVAVVPIVPPSDAAYRCLNDAQFFGRFILEVGDDVFILGYPWGIGGTLDALPIWKGGTVASIPGLGFAGRPCFLIDANTYRGMSGGPVICRHTLSLTTRKIHNHQKEIDPIAGTLQYFCGVYSGRARINQDQEEPVETDLGYVWRPELVDQIIDTGISGSAIVTA